MRVVHGSLAIEVKLKALLEKDGEVQAHPVFAPLINGFLNAFWMCWEQYPASKGSVEGFFN